VSTVCDVLVIGNCTVDLSFAVPRFPKPGETLLASDRQVDLGGKGANQAVVASRCGVPTILAAPFGLDAEGDWATARLDAEGVAQLALRTRTATDQSILYITPDSENCIVSSHGAAAQANSAWCEAIIDAVPTARTLLMQGNLSLAATVAALGHARQRGMRTVINPAPIQYGYETIFPLSDMVILNAVEAVELGGHDDPVEAGRLVRKFGVDTVIVTLGSKGAVAITAEGEFALPAPTVQAVDTVGAGDVFCGTLVARLASDVPLRQAMASAIDAAALSVTRHGTQSSFPSADELRHIFNLHRT
jgi:ribokinase